MDIVLLIHSLMRFAILPVAVVGIIMTLIALVQRKSPASLDQTVSSIFLGLYDLQVLLGLLIILLGGLTNAIHPVVMFAGAIVAHGLQAMSKRAIGANIHTLRLLMYLATLAIIVVGLAVINRLFL
ncbi:MAG: hypothetical protein HY782_13080 [Chloroflexi bacterium]|nr:hypothetical protein [Chloroflexota bacterium]